jgi:hypothetical protein
MGMAWKRWLGGDGLEEMTWRRWLFRGFAYVRLCSLSHRGWGAISPPGSASALESSVWYGFARRVAFSSVRVFQDCIDSLACEFTWVSSVLLAKLTTALSFRPSTLS